MPVAALPFPDIDPVIVSIPLGPLTLDLRWYALAYVAGFLLAWMVARRLIARPSLWPGRQAPMDEEALDGLLTAVILGVILGGRLGYVLFYQPGHYLRDPAAILRLWEGGMSFHGGLIGAALGAVWTARRHGVRLAAIADLMAVTVPIGLGLGRLANFINGELWGRPTDVPWAVVFPGAPCPPPWPEACGRHPSQLYEAGLEGLVLGVVMWLLVRRGALARPWLATGVFLAGYGAARFTVEFFRMADAQFVTPDNPWGHVLRLGSGAGAPGLTMGQLLSLPLLALGVALILRAWRRVTA